MCEAAKLQDLQNESANWKLGESYPKADRLRTQEELIFQLESKGRGKRQILAQRPSRRRNFLLLREETSFLLFSGL